jgi:hypothetical protein
MVLDWGRITRFNLVDNYIYVDNLGGSDSDAGTPTTEMDDLLSFVSIVDAQTGNTKATLQVKSISGNRIDFKTTPSRTSVWNDAISSALPDTIELDDYICSVAGVCVPMLGGASTNFMIQYAVEEMRRRLGDDSAVLEKQILDDFEKQVKSTWAGRDQATRVTKKSRFLASPRYFRR